MLFSVKLSLFILAKLVFKLVTLAGNYTVWNMESNLMVKYHLTKPLVEGTTRLIHFSVKQGQVNMSQGLSLLTWNQELSVSGISFLICNS